VLVLSREGVVVHGNAAAQELMGLSLAELVGRRLSAFLPSTQRSEPVETLVSRGSVALQVAHSAYAVAGSLTPYVAPERPTEGWLLWTQKLL